MRKVLAILFVAVSFISYAQTPTYRYLSGSNPTFLELENGVFELTEPGPRKGAVTYTDSLGNLWLFGGEGQDLNAVPGFYSDFWKYDRNQQVWTWYDGKMTVDRPAPFRNNALEFNGSSDKVEVDGSIMEYGNNFTIELWFKTTSSSFTPLISLSPQSGEDNLHGWAFRYDFDRVGFLTGNGDFLSYVIRTDPIDLKDGQWHHIAYSVEESKGIFPQNTNRIYVDGQLVSENTGSEFSFNPNSDHSILIGAERFAGSEAFYEGQIDEIRIWDKTRTSGEIMAFHDIELAGNEENLVAYYDFNQGIAGSAENRETMLFNGVEESPDGALDFSYRPATFRGEMANVRIWGTDLSDREIRESRDNSIADLNTDFLNLAYDFEDGIPGGDNFDKSILPDVSPNNNTAELQFFDLTGTQSNYFQDILPISATDFYSNNTGNDLIKLDLDGDEDQDIVSCAGNGVSVYLNDGNGDFSADNLLNVQVETRSVAAGDWNGDDIPDLAVVSYGYEQNAFSIIRVFTGAGDGTFPAFYDIETGFGSMPDFIKSADINGDEQDDFVVAMITEDIIRVYLGNGDGGFDDTIEIPVENLDMSSSAEPFVVDINKDGFIDIAVSSRIGQLNDFIVFFNDGTGGFSQSEKTTFDDISLNISLVDFDNDGFEDIIYEVRDFTDNSSTAVTLRGSGDGKFETSFRTRLESFVRYFREVGTDVEGNTEMIISNNFVQDEGYTYSIASLTEEGEVIVKRTNYTPHSLNEAIGGDFNGDGINDVILSNFGVLRVFLREQNSFDRTSDINGVSFDGFDDRIEVFNRDYLGGSFTFDAWIRASDNGPLISFAPADPSYEWNSSTGGFVLAAVDDRLTLMIEGTQDRSSNEEIRVIDNEWHHLAMRVSNYGGNENIVVFLDGDAVLFENLEFDTRLALSDPDYIFRLGYVSENFGEVLGSRAQLDGSNWQEGFDVAEGTEGRAYATSWLDSLGNLMVFGGQGESGLFNSLRKYDFASEEWLVVSGSGESGAEGFYEETGIFSPLNIPRARKNAGSVVDSEGHVWVFGGIVNENFNSPEYMNDLWTYDPVLNQWAIVSGGTEINEAAVHGIKGTAAAENHPGAREGAYMWIDENDIIYVFGGLGVDGEGNQGYLNDFWQYDTETGLWTWIAGSKTVNQAGVYGILNQPSAQNLPGSRAYGLFWKDMEGKFWLFGGFGYDKFGRDQGHLNDHWSFDPEKDQWTWHAGSNFKNSTGVYNEKGLSSTEFIPGARRDGSAWVDPDNNLWMLGGSLINRIGTGLYSDFWKYEVSRGEWTWYNGKNSTTDVNDLGVYGGLRNGSAPHPGARHGGLVWTDNDGRFWLMGGAFINGGSRGYLNDLWKYEPDKGSWEYIRGSTSLVLNDGVYGSMGVSNPSNEPKSRWHGASWVGKDNKLWFFGGLNRNQVSNDVAWINDLWVYDPASDVFTWMGGSQDIGASGKYGTKGVPSAANIPGARSSCADWVDEEGNFWLFAGYENFEYNNDLWKYNPATGQWTWVSGNSFQNTPGIYGELGVPSKDNVIGSRRYTDAWVDKEGKVWIFGGQGIDQNAQLGYLNDLWMYDPETNIWTWMHGKREFNDQGNFGEKGVEHPDNLPPARYAHTTWLDDAGNLWLMGGYTIQQDESEFSVEQSNDIWKFNIRTKNWTWIGGDKLYTDESVRGNPGEFSEDNVISGRERALAFETSDKSFYLFGGRTIANESLGDFWQIRFQPGETFVELDEAVGQTHFTFRYEEPWAEDYRLQVSVTEDFSETIFDQYSSATSLTTSDLEPGSEYYYRVDARNDIGNSGFGETHRVLTLPATPAFLESIHYVSDITPEEVTINWHSTPGILDTYTLQVSRDSSFRNQDATVDNFENLSIAGDRVNERITGLIPGTVYFARIRSVNETGESPFSAPVRFLTAPKKPTLLRVNSVTENTARINWAPVAEIFDNYKIQLSTDSTFTDPAALSGQYDLLPIGKENTGVELTGLTIGTQYYFRLFSESASGFSYPSSNLSVLTLPESPFFSEENAIRNVTQNSVEIQWETPVEIYDGFLLEVSTDESFVNPSLMLEGYGRGGQPAVFEKETTIETIEGLQPGRRYYARVRSINASGESKNSNTLELLTIPDKPEGIRVSNIGQTSATLIWESPKSDETFLIDVNTSPDFAEESEVFTELPQVFAFQILDDLLPGTTYYVRIQTRNGSGSSGEANAYDSVSFSTIPATPELRDLTAFTQSGTTVGWEPVEGAIGYRVDVSDNFFQTFLPGFGGREVNGESLEVTGMEPGRTYQIRVRSFNESGQSPSKSIFDVLTLPETPIARDASKVSANSFSINWDPATGADAYAIEVTATNLPDFLLTDTVTSVTPIDLNGLQVGINYEYRVRAINSSGASPFSEVISVLTQNSSQSLSIASIDFSDEFTASTNSLPIIISTTGGFADPVVTLRYKGITETIWSDLITLSGPNNQTFNFEVTEFMLDDIGLVFEVYATDNFVELESKNNTIKRVFSEAQSEELPELVFNEWQMISIPFVLDDDLVTSVFNELVSLEYKKQWRLMHYQNETYDDAISGFTRIELGKGYWFYSKNSVTVNVGAGQTNTEVPFTISLSAGWNQIGNPYNGELNWNSILRENSASSFVDDLNIYNTESKNFERVSRLQPFEGAFVWSDQAAEINVFPGSSLSAGRVDENEESERLNEDVNWNLPLSVTVNGHRQVLAGVGMNNDASLLKDNYDQLVPPRFTSYFEMFTTHDEFSYPFFARDIVPVMEEHVWHFDLESNEQTGRATLDWSSDLLADKRLQVWLVDEKSGSITRMDRDRSYEFDFTGRRKFSIHYSADPAYQPTTSTLILGDAYPNPASVSTRIPVLLPQSGQSYDLELAVYDIQGKKVATVADGLFEAGLHVFEWMPESDVKLPSGMYFYRLSFRDVAYSVQQKKLILRN